MKKTIKQRKLESLGVVMAINLRGESIRAYDSDATPCGCVTTDLYGGIETTVVVMFRDAEWKPRIRCVNCSTEWLEPQPPYRGLDPGPRGFEVIRQGEAA